MLFLLLLPDNSYLFLYSFVSLNHLLLKPVLGLVLWSGLDQHNNTREGSTHGHHQMVNTKIKLIIFFAAKDGDALYSQQKQDRELTVAQFMNSLLPISDLN